MATPTPRVTARMTVSTYPDIGQAATTTLDTEVILPIVLLGGSSTSSTWNAQKIETRKIAAADTGIVFEMPGDAVMVALFADGPFTLRLGTGETDLENITAHLIATDGTPFKTGDLAFEVDGNGTTPVNLSVFLLSKT